MLPTIAKLAKKHKIHPIKKYSQNFLFDQNLCEKIINHSKIQFTDKVVEIGAGTGGLTQAILKVNPENLTVIEPDKQFLPLLYDIKNEYNHLNIINDDALKINYYSNNIKIHIVANTPYHISHLLLINWIHNINNIAAITIMLQKEVANRIIARAGTKEYGRISVLCQLIFNIKKCFNVNPNAFYPKPKIASTLIRLTPKQILPSKIILEKVQKITLHTFSMRRKIIKNSLAKIPSIININQIIKELGINANLRAEDLSPQDYLLIAKKC